MEKKVNNARSGRDRREQKSQGANTRRENDLCKCTVVRYKCIFFEQTVLYGSINHFLSPLKKKGKSKLGCVSNEKFSQFNICIIESITKSKDNKSYSFTRSERGSLSSLEAKSLLIP